LQIINEENGVKQVLIRTRSVAKSLDLISMRR